MTGPLVVLVHVAFTAGVALLADGQPRELDRRGSIEALVLTARSAEVRVAIGGARAAWGSLRARRRGGGKGAPPADVGVKTPE